MPGWLDLRPTSLRGLIRGVREQIKGLEELIRGLSDLQGPIFGSKGLLWGLRWLIYRYTKISETLRLDFLFEFYACELIVDVLFRLHESLTACRYEILFEESSS